MYYIDPLQLQVEARGTIPWPASSAGLIPSRCMPLLSRHGYQDRKGVSQLPYYEGGGGSLQGINHLTFIA